MVSINPLRDELHNCVVEDGEVCARPGYQTVATLLSAVVFGFTLNVGSIDDVNHYVISRIPSSGDGYCTVYSEQFRQLYQVNLGKIPENPAVYYGVQNNQIVINSPHFNYPLYGIVGGGLVPATAGESINPDTTSLTIPLGITCEFGDRFVISDETSTNVLFSDPDVSPKTFVAQNILHIPGATIYHMEQADDGMLAIFTTNGVFGLDRTALSQAQNVSGFLSKLPGYQAQNYRCAASTNGALLALVKDGVANVLDGFSLVPVPTPRAKHALTRPVRPYDYRHGTLHKTANGALVAYDGRALILDIKLGFTSWHYTNDGATVKGVLRTRDGDDILLLDGPSADEAVIPLGEFDDRQSSVDGYAVIYEQAPAEQSQMLRRITVSSNNPGFSTYVYVRGSPSDVSTVLTPATGIVIGTDSWAATGSASNGGLIDRERTSVRHDVATRTDQLSLEIGVQGSGRSLGDYHIATANSGRLRP